VGRHESARPQLRPMHLLPRRRPQLLPPCHGVAASRWPLQGLALQRRAAAQAALTRQRQQITARAKQQAGRGQGAPVGPARRRPHLGRHQVDRGRDRPIGRTERRGFEYIAAATAKEGVVDLHRQTEESVVRLQVQSHHLHARAPGRLWRGGGGGSVRLACNEMRCGGWWERGGGRARVGCCCSTTTGLERGRFARAARP